MAGKVTHKKMAALAARAMRAPSTLSAAEVKALAACVLTQAPPKKKAPPKK